MKKRIAAAVALSAVMSFWAGPPAEAAPTDLDYVVDGDTVRLVNGQYVRFIGIDTPEIGQPCAAKAKATVERLTRVGFRLENPIVVEDKDFYDRLLRYVHGSGKDVGLVLIRRGLADARYDSRDGYGWHPREFRYKRADANNPDQC